MGSLRPLHGCFCRLPRVRPWAQLERNRDAPDIKPDKTVIFDLPTEVAAARLSRKLDRFEQEDADFHRRVRQGYLEIAKKEPERCVVIDAQGTPEEVSAHVLKEVDTWV